MNLRAVREFESLFDHVFVSYTLHCGGAVCDSFALNSILEGVQRSLLENRLARRQVLSVLITAEGKRK